MNLDKFKLDNKTAIITGGTGLLGVQHAEALAECGADIVLWDISDKVEEKAIEIQDKYSCVCEGMKIDITNKKDIFDGFDKVLENFNTVDILINNAANNPKIEKTDNDSVDWSRFETFDLNFWNKDIVVGLTGAFLCSQVIGSYMADNGGGVIINIASDLGVIAPDQRIYKKDGIENSKQKVKPVTYSVVKHGLIGLTKYLSTYWADKNVRVNSLCPGGIYQGQPDEFVGKLTNLIPMGRMAKADEYKGAVQFLASDASSYMTGSNLVIDGGRTVW